MKKNLLTISALAVIGAGVFFVACKKDRSVAGESRSLEAGIKVTYPNNGEISDTIVNSGDTLYLTGCTNTFFLSGKTYINPGGVIVIDSGVTIKGRKSATAATASALVVTVGGKILAFGTPTDPITFTSAEAAPASGDWGGIVVLGDAPTNQANPRIEGIANNVPAGVSVNYGGSDVNDNSGILRYINIKYAGAAIAANDELNSLTFGGVGSQTEVHHISAQFGADDSFEFFGGNVNAKYLISRGANDDNFDFDFGYTGQIQFGLVIADGSNVYNNDANGIESDNMGSCQATPPAPLTHAHLSNFTIIGGSSATGKQAGTLYALRLRRNTNITFRNSIVMGYDSAVIVNGCTPATTTTDSIQNNIITAFLGTQNLALPGTNTLSVNASNSNALPVLRVPFGTWCNTSLSGFDAEPNASSPALSGAAWGWASGYPFFNQVTYRGAIDPATTTTTVWTRFACLQGCN